jgi:prepilin-type N-terminal cleavage/methylation domain-containing protein
LAQVLHLKYINKKFLQEVVEMLKSIRSKKSEKGFTLIELLVVAAIIGILLAIAIPNLIKARMSANEANARKAMQTLRDAEGEYFEQDLNNLGSRDYTDLIGALGTANSLRDPEGTSDEQDALVDDSFEGASDTGGTDCSDSKAGYCITNDFAAFTANASGGFDDFGWEASMVSWNKTGRRDFSVYGDGVIRCVVPVLATGDPGAFSADRTTSGCD